MVDKILLAHGSGGKLSHELVEKRLLAPLKNRFLSKLDDAAVFDLEGRMAFTTDSYVVSPLLFPGGDMGKLAVCGTVNDLSMMGAEPLYISLSLIIEEGFDLSVLDRIILSVQRTAQEAGVMVVTGDTKVVNRRSVDGLFINTAGIGRVPQGIEITGSNARVGDKVILSGTIGDHGIAVLSQREGLRFEIPLKSDCAPLNHLVADMIKASREIHCLRDPTRGGLAGTLNEIAGSSNVGIRIHEDQIPVSREVHSACALLGLDPLHVANEGKLVGCVATQDAQKVLCKMRENRYGRQATVIGEVVAEHSGSVVIITRLGTSRFVNMISGELLPRIC
jgi:hydrogenase expression/formation protein HypE